MRKAFPILAVLCAMLLVPPPARPQTAAVIEDDSARVIVKYKADSPLLRNQAFVPDAQLANQAQALGLRVGLALRPAPVWPSTRTWCSPAG